MKEEMQIVVTKLFEISSNRETSEQAYDISYDIHNLIEEMDKGCPVVNYLKTLEDNTVKMIRLLYQVGKGNDCELEDQLRNCTDYKERVNLLQKFYDHLMGDSKAVDIATLDNPRLAEKIHQGYLIVFN